MSDISVYKPDMFVFVDETDTDRRDALRKFGYSLRGKPARALNLFIRGGICRILVFTQNSLIK